MNNKYRILIFAGTIEGRTIANFLNQHKIHTHVCVATDYGKSLLPAGQYITSVAKRLDQSEMEALMQREKINLVIDATHPYAALVSNNIKLACIANQVEYIRLLRDSLTDVQSDCIYVEDTKACVEYLKTVKGNVLVTTGSKELGLYQNLPDYQSRIYARVLSTPEVMKECSAVGFTGKHLIGMQGPFTRDLNLAMIKQIDAAYLVTKESGRVGGFEEKLEAASLAEIVTIIIGRPVKEEGFSLWEVKKILIDKLSLSLCPEIYIIGIGMGSIDNMTCGAYEICKQADVVIGAKRMTDTIAALRKETVNLYQPDQVQHFIKTHPEYETIAILLSGDVGFYSGAKKLVDTLQIYSPKVIAGISSVVYFSAKVNKPWEHIKLLSLHGRNANLVNAVQNHPLVFTLLDRKTNVKDICKELIYYGMDDVKVYIGENLSYPTERILKGKPEEFLTSEFSDICVMIIENKKTRLMPITHGISDDMFMRSRVPMTKSEIRSISLSKLELQKDSIIYDVGAGTGSVAIEMAIQANQGIVYAIEQKVEAVQLIKENAHKFRVANISILHGQAPDMMADLPVPTHAFIGGSSGKMAQIIDHILAKNPKARIVINAIALETISEIINYLKDRKVDDVDLVCVNVAKAKKAGGYHMMMGQNPVYIISFTGEAGEDAVS